MFDLEINDTAGSSLLLQLGGGVHRANSWVGSALQAQVLVNSLSTATLETICQHFQPICQRHPGRQPANGGRHTLPARTFVTASHPLHPSNALPPGDNKQWLQQRLVNADILVYYTHIVAEPSRAEIDQDRVALRSKVHTHLQHLLAVPALLLQPNHGDNHGDAGDDSHNNSAAQADWGFQVWQQHRLDERNPVQQAYTRFKNQSAANLGTAGGGATPLSAEDLQLVTRLGFNPSAVTSPMLQQSWEATDHALNGPALHNNLEQFAHTYSAKHPQLAGRSVSRAGLTEFILTLSLASLCEGLRALSAPGDTAPLLNTYQKVGTSLVDFSEATKKLARLRTLPHNEARSFSDFERENFTPNTAPPAAPEFGWVELTLTYDDHEPIAKQKYIIVDCAGTQHTGVTNEKGMARLTGLLKGSVEIRFPEVRGWH